MSRKEPPDHIDRIIAQWRIERPELNTEPMAVLGRLFRAERLSDSSLSRALAPHGLQPGWFDLLAALRRSGAPYELSPTELARHDALLGRHDETHRSTRRVWAHRAPTRPRGPPGRARPADTTRDGRHRPRRGGAPPQRGA